MFGKKRGIGSGGYIKKNTQGTSNEISFSVLDAMKNSSEKDTGEEETPLGKISLFTLGKRKDPPSTPSKGAQITMPESSSKAKRSGSKSISGQGAAGSSFSASSLTAEASIRKKQRKRSKRVVLLIGILIALCALFVGGVFAVNGIQSQMSQSDRMRLAIDDAKSQMDSLAEFRTLLKASKQESLDQLITDGFVDKATKAVNEIPSALTKLRAAKTKIEDLQNGLFSPIESENANQAISDLNEYISILEQGKDTLSQVSDVVKSYQKALEYKSLLLEADSLAREAIEISNASTDEAFNQALEKSKDAFNKFASARDIANSLGNQTQELFEAAPIGGLNSVQLMQPYVDYANLRVQAQDFAIAADEAFLATNSAKMIEANNSYNDLETQAAELIAQQNGKFPSDLITEAFNQLRKQDQTAR